MQALLTDADFDRELMRRAQIIADSGERLKVTLTKAEIEELAERKYWGGEIDEEDYAEVLEEILALDMGDIMAVLKRTREIARETFAVQGLLRELDMAAVHIPELDACCGVGPKP